LSARGKYLRFGIAKMHKWPTSPATIRPRTANERLRGQRIYTGVVSYQDRAIVVGAVGNSLEEFEMTKGQGLAEYALILALIAIVAVAALIFLSGSITSILSTIGAAL
jgi:Flp pilus assembly pilin Flp